MTHERSIAASWGTFLIILIAGIAYSISLMAIPTAMIYVADTFGGDMVGAGWLMSWNSVAGTILALFTASIQSKIGPKNMIIIALACILVSDVMVVMTTDITIAFVGRFIFGFANGLIATAGPTFVTILFSDPTKRGMRPGAWGAAAGEGLGGTLRPAWRRPRVADLRVPVARLNPRCPRGAAAAGRSQLSPRLAATFCRQNGTDSRFGTVLRAPGLRLAQAPSCLLRVSPGHG